MSAESSTNLCISATFLSRIYHGRGDNGSEWPPSPFRMFQALTAAAFGGCGDPDHAGEFRAALLWLEKRPPPDIVAPGSQNLEPYRLYVPNNDGDKVMRDYALGKAANFSSIRTRKVVEQCLIDEPGQVHFLWRLDGDRPPEIMRRLARRVSALGPPQDVAVCDSRVVSDIDVGQLRGERLVAVSGDSYSTRHRLLCPERGSLDELEHREKTRRFGTIRRYHLKNTQRIAYRPADEAPSRPFAAFALRRIDESSCFQAFDQERCICVSAMARHVALQAALADLGGWRTKEWAERFVAGHQGDDAGGGARPRFSYVPLPSVGGDGAIRRVLIAEHVGGDGHSAKWAASRLAGAVLLKEPDEQQVARLEAIGCSDSVIREYVGSSMCWETITPVILPGFDKRKSGRSDGKHTKLLHKCLTDSGYDLAAVESIESRQAAFNPSSAGEHRRPRYLQRLPAYHVRIRFRSAISGPLMLGAGRHCGLGVFVAC